MILPGEGLYVLGYLWRKKACRGELLEDVKRGIYVCNDEDGLRLEGANIRSRHQVLYGRREEDLCLLKLRINIGGIRLSSKPTCHIPHNYIQPPPWPSFGFEKDISSL